MLTLQTLAYDEARGRDMVKDVGSIQFTPADYRDREAAAEAFCQQLKFFAKANGYNPDNVIMNPSYSAGHHPCVCWEEGPFQWGQYMTNNLHGEAWYTEPYHSFDVCFARK